MKSHALVVSTIFLASVAGAQTPAAHSATPSKTAVHHVAHTSRASTGSMHVNVVSEDPQTGAFTAVVTVPDGYRFKPASHPADQWIIVKKGSLTGAQGNTWDAKAIAANKPLVAGDSMTLAAGRNYFGVAKGATEYIICSPGRNATTYANAADDPSRVPRRASR